MKPYDQLTQRGKYRRLLGMAKTIMNEYDLQVKRVSFFQQATNIHYKVVTMDGEKYVLRFYTDTESTLMENRTEVFWLNALCRDTGLKVVEPVARVDGAFINTSSAPGIPGEQRSVLFRWIPGRTLEEQIKPVYYRQLGAMTAQLHAHAGSLQLPPEIQPKSWDTVFYYPGEKAIYREPAFSHFFSPERITMMDDSIERCNALLADLYAGSSPPRLIHGDLHFWNVHVHRGQLYLLDFEDIMLGYPVQDIAVTFYYGFTRPDYANLKAAYRQGYESVLPWPVELDDQIAGLTAARLTNFINYVAEYDLEAEEFLGSMFARLEQTLKAF